MKGRIPNGAESTSKRHEENRNYYERNKETLRARQKETYREKAKERRIQKLNSIIAEYNLPVQII